MSEYNNSPARLHRLFLELFKKSGTKVNRSRLAKAFCVADEWPSLFQAYCDLLDEFESLKKAVDDLPISPKREMYLNELPDIQLSLNSFIFSQKNDDCYFEIKENAVRALQFMSVDEFFVRSQDANEDDLHRIRQIVSELQTEIEQSTEFSRGMKEWLLDLVRVMRDSLDRYANRGTRGMRKHFAMLLGELALEHGYREDLDRRRPLVWLKFLEGMALISSIANIFETGLNLIEKLCPEATSSTQALIAYKEDGDPGVRSE
ncbi:MAG: hypothetical protein JNK57_15610 [Planctomycetaceae bacterium]|nr:hypothetical protein [Planctomycetaceae bacterium]